MVVAAKESRPHVTVACKVAVGWMDLRIFEEIEVKENTQTGPRLVKQWRATGHAIRIRGTAYPRGEPPEGFPEKPQMILGYALTPGVHRDLWEAYEKQNARSPLILNKMIIAFESDADIRAVGKEQSAVLSGLEPIQRVKKDLVDTRIVRPTNGAISAIEPDAARMASRASG